MTVKLAKAVEYTDCSGVKPRSTTSVLYDTKQSDGEAPEILELWGIWSTLSLPSLPGPLWHGVVVPDRVLSLVKIELSDIKTVCKQITYGKLNC